MLQHRLPCLDVEVRARLSQGRSTEPVYEMVRRALPAEDCQGGIVLDVGCGAGSLWEALRPLFDRYVGCDVARYDDFPHDAEFVKADLDAGSVPLPDAFADVVAALETIEHLENPRAFFRELVRLTRPGGWVVVTTPNQLSLLSKLTLVLKNQFNAFQASSYPAHISALLEVDLRRMAAECGLTAVQTAFSIRGRVPGTGRHYPKWVSRLLPRSLSDNILLLGRKPAVDTEAAEGKDGCLVAQSGTGRCG
jgi:2-polyprenyl-3-methyl-5-hydroxy-6-metoxy-1,4-benzoquinol methylase